MSSDANPKPPTTAGTPPTNGQSVRSVYWGNLFAAVLTAIIGIGVLAIFLIYVVDVSFLKEASCRKIEATPFFNKYTYCFYGDDWDESTYLSAVSGFYSTLIAVLVAVQAIVSGLAFLVVRNSNKRAIEDEVETQLPIYFGTLKAASYIKDIVNDISANTVKTAVEQETADLAQKLEDVSKSFYGLQSNYEELRVRFDNAMGEDEGDEAQAERITE